MKNTASTNNTTLMIADSVEMSDASLKNAYREKSDSVRKTVESVSFVRLVNHKQVGQMETTLHLNVSSNFDQHHA